MCRLDGLCTSAPNLTEVSDVSRVEWLQWAINDTFKQGFTVPNVYVSGTVQNTEANAYVHVGVGFNNPTNGPNNLSPSSFIASHWQATVPMDAGTVHSAIIGAEGSAEGYHFATFLMSNGGSHGMACMRSGAIYTSPLES